MHMTFAYVIVVLNIVLVVFCIQQLTMFRLNYYTPRGTGAPSFSLVPIHFPVFCFFLLSLFLVAIFFFCPSLYFLPE